MWAAVLTCLAAGAWGLGCGSEVIHEPGAVGGAGGGSVGGGQVGAGGVGGVVDPGPVGARPPPPPQGAGPGDGAGAVLAMSHLYLGDTDRNGAPSPSAWKQYGYDLDGLVSTKDSTDLCHPAAGGAPSIAYPDGNDGIDNSFGRSILPIWMGLAQDASGQVNDSIVQGDGTLLFEIEALGSSPSYLDLPSRAYHGAPYLGLPAWNGGDSWRVTSESLSNPSDPQSALWSFADSYLTQNTWVASPAGDLLVRLPLADFDLSLLIHHAVVTMQLSGDRSHATMGIIAGVLDTEEHINMLQQVAGSFDPALCSGTTFDSIADQLRQASDIMKDGSQDPDATCDGISIGLGFDAIAAGIDGVAAPVPPAPDPCG